MMVFVFSFIAGGLTTLSPCVLPVLPIIVGGALREHRYAPISIAFGLISSFVIVGWSTAAFGSFLGLDARVLRIASSLLLGGFGLVLLSDRLQDKVTSILSPIAAGPNKIMQNPKFKGVLGQFLVGLLLGVVWSPCSGPTLGIALTLAAQEGGRLESGLLMLAFGIGASVPLLLIAYGAQNIFRNYRAEVFRGVGVGKRVFGVLLLTTAAFVILGLDRQVEGWIVERLPNAFVDLTTRF